MALYTQDERLISIESPLAKDELLLTAFQGSEHLSRIFEFQIDVLSYNLQISPEKLIGEKVTLTIQNDQERTFNGYISHFYFGEIKANNLREYRLTMVPWLWFLGKTQNQRIFQNKTTKDIVSKVFDDLGFKDYEFKTSSGSTREYCVQYGESDLNFISRLLEEDGFAYFFKQEDKNHKMVIVDQKNAYEACVEAEVSYSKGNRPGTQINIWEHKYEFRKGKWTINDYNFEEPAKDLMTEVKSKNNFANVSKFEHYEFPSMYDTGMGSNLVRVRMEAEEAPIDTVKASSDCSTFYAGGKFKLNKHDNKNEMGEYIITAIHHSAYDSSYFSGNQGSSEYRNNFVCMPAEVHFRPQRTHIKPVMKGPQTAVVTGPSGEEIYIDEHGRIKVQFMWDREGRKDENTTCFLRVVQSWAGNGWGTSFIPRIGHEVIVNFLDGDPDRPLVTGSVYNGANKPVYPSKTQSGIKTRSTKGGSTANFNELRFEDKKGSEQVYLHAEKDLDSKIENNETHTVDKDRTKTIGENETSSIGKNRDKSVGENQTESIGKNKTIDVGENHKETIGKDKTLDVTGNHSESIGKNMTISIGKNLSEEVTGAYNEDVTKEYSLKAKKITMNADDEILLKTGSASILLKKNGDITIKGKNINIKGSGDVIIKGSKVATN
ncbi:MAG: type VI secretion system tip protein VgrG [Gammaproteobacteria bacterium]|nr:type VI secretion system tip protein VgrG [Gammaproteobacteria bacterium]